MHSGAYDSKSNTWENVGVVSLARLKSLTIQFKLREWRSTQNKSYVRTMDFNRGRLLIGRNKNIKLKKNERAK